MKVYIIRHGESLNNKNKLWTGWFDAPLTEKGKEDAARAGELLSKVNFDKIYSSDLTRAKNTAEIAIPGCEYETSELLREINVGRLAGTPIDFANNEQKMALAKDGYDSFGGESREAFISRIESFMKELEALRCDKVAVFCHGGWLRTFFDIVFGVLIPRGKIICGNCAVGVFEFDGASWKLNSWINLD